MANQRMIRDGDGYTYTQGPWGMSLEIDFPRTSTDHPFKVKLSGLKFKVVPGTVNGVMPKMDGTSTRLDDTPAPEKTISESGYVYLECQHNASEDFPVAVKVKYATSVPANSEEFLNVHIATINVTSGKATKTAQVVTTSLAAEYFKCGSGDPEYYVSQA